MLANWMLVFSVFSNGSDTTQFQIPLTSEYLKYHMFSAVDLDSDRLSELHCRHSPLSCLTNSIHSRLSKVVLSPLCILVDAWPTGLGPNFCAR